MADGSVIIKVDADEKAAVKKLHQVEREIDKLREKLSEKQSGKSLLVQESERLQAEISRLRQAAKAENLKWQGGDVAAGQRESELLAKIPALKTQMEKVNAEIDKYEQAIDSINQKLGKQEGIYADTQKQVAALEKQNSGLAAVTDQVQSHMDRFANRVKGLAKRVFVFTVITAAFRQLRDHMALAVKSNDEASAAFARLKGAVLTLVQPLVNLLLPALTWIANALTRVISVLAQLFSMLTGKSFSSAKQAAKNLNAQKKALEGVGDAADDAAGSLAGFDEINTISTDTGGGGGADAALSPDFDFGGEMDMGNLKNILGLLKAIGAALLAWKFSNGFLDGMRKFLGFALALDGAIGYAKAFADIWSNGLNTDNLLTLLGRALEIVAGLWLAFGKVGGAIGLIVAGLGFLVAGFHDAFENGWNLHNLLLSIAGIFAIGMGIGLLTGSWIPLLVAGIAAVLLALTVLTGNGEELLDGLKQMFEGLKDFIVGIFTGDLERAFGGIKTLFDGFGKVANAVISGVVDGFNAFLDQLDELTGGRLSGILNAIRELFTGQFENIRTTIADVIQAVEDIFLGLTQFLAGVFTGDWETAWEGIKNIFKGVWNGIASLFGGAVNAVIKGANWLISQLNKIKWNVPDWVPVIGGKKLGISIPKISEYRIPALATGTVVPPNREFLAMLGDNKTEHEVVSPLSTIKQAVAEAMAENGGGGEQVFHLYIDGKQVAVQVVKHVNQMTRESGKPVILY